MATDGGYTCSSGLMWQLKHATDLELTVAAPRRPGSTKGSSHGGMFLQGPLATHHPLTLMQTSHVVMRPNYELM